MNAQDWRAIETAIIDTADHFVYVEALGEDDVEARLPDTETCEIARMLAEKLRAVGFEIRAIER